MKCIPKAFLLFLIVGNINAQVPSIQKHFENLLETDTLLLIEPCAFKVIRNHCYFSLPCYDREIVLKTKETMYYEKGQKTNFHTSQFYRSVSIELHKCKNWVENYNQKVMKRITAKLSEQRYLSSLKEIDSVNNVLEEVKWSLEYLSDKIPYYPEIALEKLSTHMYLSASYEVDYFYKTIDFKIFRDFELKPFFEGRYSVRTDTYSSFTPYLNTSSDHLFSFYDISLPV